MRELSLNVMDVAQNSITAGASLIEISLREDSSLQNVIISIADNGKGMTEEQVQSVTNPFFTTRTTRKVGLGVPFFKMSSEQTGGSFSIDSKPGEGTIVTSAYNSAHIDMTPIGNMSETILLLVTCNPELDFLYTHERDGKSYTLNTRELKEILGDVPLSSPDVALWIRGYLDECEGEL